MRRLDLAVVLAASLAAMPSEAQTKGLSQADVKAINESTQAAVKAALAKDFAAWAALFAEDGVLNPPNEPSVQGRAAIHAWLARFPPMTAFTLENVKVEGRDGLAYVLGTYTLTILPPGAPGPITDAGKFVEIRRKAADGRWLVAVDMFSSNSPPAP